MGTYGEVCNNVLQTDMSQGILVGLSHISHTCHIALQQRMIEREQSYNCHREVLTAS